MVKRRIQYLGPSINVTGVVGDPLNSTRFVGLTPQTVYGITHGVVPILLHESNDAKFVDMAWCNSTGLLVLDYNAHVLYSVPISQDSWTVNSGVKIIVGEPGNAHLSGRNQRNKITLEYPTSVTCIDSTIYIMNQVNPGNKAKLLETTENSFLITDPGVTAPAMYRKSNGQQILWGEDCSITNQQTTHTVCNVTEAVAFGSQLFYFTKNGMLYSAGSSGVWQTFAITHSGPDNSIDGYFTAFHALPHKEDGSQAVLADNKNNQLLVVGRLRTDQHRPDIIPTKSEFTIQTGYRCGISSYQQTITGTAEACGYLCIKSTQCQGFDFQMKTGSCELYDKIREPISIDESRRCFTWKWNP